MSNLELLVFAVLFIPCLVLAFKMGYDFGRYSPKAGEGPIEIKWPSPVRNDESPRLIMRHMVSSEDLDAMEHGLTATTKPWAGRLQPAVPDYLMGPKPIDQLTSPAKQIKAKRRRKPNATKVPSKGEPS